MASINNNATNRIVSDPWNNIKHIHSVANRDGNPTRSFDTLLGKPSNTSKPNVQYGMSNDAPIELNNNQELSEQPETSEPLEQLFESVETLIELVQTLLQTLQNDSSMPQKEYMESQFQQIAQEIENYVYRNVLNSHVLAFKSVFSARQLAFESIYNSQKLAFQNMGIR